MDLFQAFLLTNLIEFFPFHFQVKKPFPEKAFALLLVNALTLPALWLLLPLFFNHYLTVFIILEAAVFLAEAFLFTRFLGQPLRKALAVSFSINFLSAFLGFLFF